MTKIYDLISLNNHLYMVDKEQTTSQCDAYMRIENGKSDHIYHLDGTFHPEKDDLKILAASESLGNGLPLLPAIEEDVPKIAAKHWMDIPQEVKTFAEPVDYIVGFVEGYKAAKAKRYSEEDMRKCWDAAINRLEWIMEAAIREKYPESPTLEDFIKSLNPLPKQVEVEMEIDTDDKRNWYVDCPSGKYWEDEPIPPSKNNLYSNASHLKPVVENSIIKVVKWIYD